MEDRETLLLVLGAGASFDCLPGIPPGVEGWAVANPHLPTRPVEAVRPPLTKDLAQPTEYVNAVLDHWPLARPVVEYLRDALRVSDSLPATTLEVALHEYIAQEEQLPERRTHVLAFRFYLRELIWGCTSYMMSASLTGGVLNHLTLIRRIAEWAARGNRCCVVTSFNYDLLFERALESYDIGFSASRLDDYQRRMGVFSIVKPHGSVQWLNPVTNARPILVDRTNHERLSLEAACRGTVGVEFEVAQQAGFESSGQMLDRRPAVPALALPIDGKTEFVSPPGHLDRLGELQGAVTRVLTIGWRAAEPHFTSLLRPLVKAHARVLVVTGEEREASVVANQLRTTVDVLGGGFAWSGAGFGGLLTNPDSRLGWLLDD